jgi:translation initiation factor 6
LSASRMSILGSPNIGVYALATNNFVLVPPGISDAKAKRLESFLVAPVIRASLGGTVLLGILAAANSNGMVVPGFVSDEEIQVLSSIVGNVVRVESKRNALGNLILVNDRGALVSESLYREKSVISKIQDVLGVEMMQGQIAGRPYVGSLAAVTNSAALVHPLVEDEEKKLISESLKVNVDTGTVNGGCPLVHSGILVNDHGFVVGSLAVGSELMIITNLFGI